MMRAGFCKYGSRCHYSHEVTLPEIPSFPSLSAKAFVPADYQTIASGAAPCPESKDKTAPSLDAEPTHQYLDQNLVLEDLTQSKESACGVVDNISQFSPEEVEDGGIYYGLTMDRAFMLWRMHAALFGSKTSESCPADDGSEPLEDAQNRILHDCSQADEESIALNVILDKISLNSALRIPTAVEEIDVVEKVSNTEKESGVETPPTPDND